MRYDYLISSDKVEVWTTYQGECGEQITHSGVLTSFGKFDLNAANMSLDNTVHMGFWNADDWLCVKPETKPCAKIPCPTFGEVDWRDAAWSCMMKEDNTKESALFSKAAVSEAFEFLAECKREAEIEEILQRVIEWGEDTYAVGTVFRFGKEFTSAQVTGASAGIGAGFPAKVYTYAVVKIDTGEWASTGRSQFVDWETFVKFLVTEGSPVLKEDVEIFPPAVFPAAAAAADGGVAETSEEV